MAPWCKRGFVKRAYMACHVSGNGFQNDFQNGIQNGIHNPPSYYSFHGMNIRDLLGPVARSLMPDATSAATLSDTNAPDSVVAVGSSTPTSLSHDLGTVGHF